MVAEEFTKLLEGFVISTFYNLFGNPDSSCFDWGVDDHVSKDPCTNKW